MTIYYLKSVINICCEKTNGKAAKLLMLTLVCRSDYYLFYGFCPTPQKTIFLSWSDQNGSENCKSYSRNGGGGGLPKILYKDRDQR